MSVYRTLILAGVIALSANPAMAQSGAGGRGGEGGQDGRDNQRIRDDIYNEGFYGPGPGPLEGGPYLDEGRAAVVGPPPEGYDLEPAPPMNPRYYRRYPSSGY